MRPRPARSGIAHLALWRRYRKTRSPDLRNRLLETYLPLVSLVASRVAHRLPSHVDPDDLESVGVFGLFRAIDHFDPERGIKFETYCKKRVAGAMLDELRKNDWIPREARDRVHQLRAARERFVLQFSREPSDFELARAMNVPLRTIHDVSIELALTAMIPLADEKEDDEGRGHRFHPVDALPEPPEAASRSELWTLVDGQLSHTERALVHGYYRDEHTMKRIGTRLRLSESRVSQLHHSMLTRLKARLHAEVAP